MSWVYLHSGFAQGLSKDCCGSLWSPVLSLNRGSLPVIQDQGAREESLTLKGTVALNRALGVVGIKSDQYCEHSASPRVKL